MTMGEPPGPELQAPPFGIASLRSQAADGHLRIRRPPTSVAGRLLGAALLVDTVPIESRRRAGQRFATAVLSIQWRPGAPDEPTVAGEVVEALGGPASVTADVRVSGLTSRLAVGRTSFVEIEPPRRRSPPTAVEPSMPEDLDAVAATVHRQLGATDESIEPGWRANLEIDAWLRNRHGPMHGAAVYCCLAIVALAAAGAPQPRSLVDSRVRYLRPIVEPDVLVEVTSLARSRRLVDIGAAVTSADGMPLAVASFVVAIDPAGRAASE